MARSPKKFYAVRVGRHPGIYLTWEKCKAQVDGYAKAEFKGFNSRYEAEAFLGEAKPAVASAKPQKLPLEPARAARPKRKKAVSEQEAKELLKTDDGLKHVVIYTDGACTGNPGPGGYGVVLLHGEHRKELSGGFRLTTNNRMEMLGCIVGLQTLKGQCAVTIYSDSRYVVNSMTKGWARRWRNNGWKKREDEAVKNPDLWEQMLELCEQHQVRFNWVRGHTGNAENERCDELARAAAAGFKLAIDKGYEEKL
jgi:ribonuclease HI